MSTQLDKRIMLRKDGLRAIRDAANTRVVVLTGKVWIAEAGDSRDHFLRPNESMVLRSGGLVVLSACEESMVVLMNCETRVGRHHVC